MDTKSTAEGELEAGQEKDIGIQERIIIIAYGHRSSMLVAVRYCRDLDPTAGVRLADGRAR